MEIGKIKDYFEQDIQYQQALTSKLSKYLTFFYYADKILTVFLTVFFWNKHFCTCQRKKTITWFDYICFLFSILFKFRNN